MDYIRKNISLRFIVNVVILLAIQVFIADKLLMYISKDIYFQDVFSFELLRQRQVWVIAPIVLGLLIWNYLPIVQNCLKHQWSWSALTHGKALRVVIMAVVIIMTWAFATYSYNYYYDLPHYLDRFLLVLLAVLVYVNPLFIIPFTMVCYLMSGQFMYPVPYAYTDKQMIYEFMALFGCFVAVRPFVRGRTQDFVFVGLCLIGAYYYFPGIEKLHIGAGSSINWITDNDLHHYIVFSYQKGWLAFRSPELVQTMTDLVEFFQVPFQLFTVIMEVGIIFMFVLRRRFAMGILALGILLHTGIMISAGVFFWKWMTLDAAMIWFLWRYGNSQEIAPLFKPIPAVLSMLIIASGSLFFDVHHLGWWNSPIHTQYKFEVIDTEGDRYDFAYSYLQPYDFAITQNRLHTTFEGKSISSVNGAVGEPEIYWKARSLTLEDVPAFIEEYGRNRYNPVRAERLRELLRVYAYNININYQPTFLPAIIRPPMHINSQPFPDAYNFEHPIAEVRIRMIISFYDGEQVHIVSDEVIDSMPITIPD